MAPVAIVFNPLPVGCNRKEEIRAADVVAGFAIHPGTNRFDPPEPEVVFDLALERLFAPGSRNSVSFGLKSARPAQFRSILGPHTFQETFR
jgi:hypothetical protein